jgi:hypothetical protein
MKNKAKYSIIVIILILASISYLLFVSPVVWPILTGFAIVILLLSVLFIFIITNKVGIIKNKKGQIFLTKKS